MLSIITICYNEKSRIEMTCQSISSQKSPAYEWIVIDGASNDGTLDILENYRQYMSVFLSESDSGIYNAMNKGIAQAKGDFLLFLNAGDYLANENVVKKFDDIDKNNKEIIISDIYYENPNGRIYPACYFDQYKGNIKKTLGMGYTFFHQSTFVKKELFDKYGCYDESYKIAGDYDFFLRTAVKHNCNVDYVPFFVSVFYMEGIGRDEQHKKIWSEEVNRAIHSNYSKTYLLFRHFSIKKGKNTRRFERLWIRLRKSLLKFIIHEINVIIDDVISSQIDILHLRNQFNKKRINIIILKRENINDISCIDDRIVMPSELSNYLNVPAIRKRLGRCHLLLIRGKDNEIKTYLSAYNTMMNSLENRVIHDVSEENEVLNHAYIDLDFEMIFDSCNYKYDMKTRVVK